MREQSSHVLAAFGAGGLEDGESEQLASAEATQQPDTQQDPQESPMPASPEGDGQRNVTPSPNSGARSWAVYHRSVESLVGRAQVAVRGKVQSVEATSVAPATALVRPAESEAWWTNPASASASSGELAVYKQGTASGSERDPLPAVGEDLIVFFRVRARTVRRSG